MSLDTVPTIVVCDDDHHLLALLEDELCADGFAPLAAGTRAGARELLCGGYPDALILDLSLPDGSGLGLVREIRSGAGDEIDPRLPVIALSGHCSESDRVRAFEFGCDDFVAKPFSYRELRGRLQALLRRCDNHSRAVRMRVGPVAIDSHSREVHVGERPIALTAKEFSLLRVLAGEPTRVYTKQELLRAVWGYRAPHATTTRTLDSHACRLRAKLAAAGAPRMVLSVWGVGYRLSDGVTEGRGEIAEVVA